MPNLSILPPPQRRLYDELDTTPEYFTLYGGTALALRLGHRVSVDFDFFSDQPFNPDELAGTVPYLRAAERVQMTANTLTCRVERQGSVLVSFFGGLSLGRVSPPEQPQGKAFHVAALLDLAGTKMAVVQERAEARDYIDIDAIIRCGIDLPTALAAGRVVYGRRFNPLITLKALTYFDDVPALPAAVIKRLVGAVTAADPLHLPVLAADRARIDEDNWSMP